MKYISICSGIEAATVAFHGFGWTPLAFSEIEPFPSAVLAARWPQVPNLGDMTKFAEWPEEILAECDLLVGGPPCQAFSVAGLRKSLDDDRGNITLAYVRLLNHIDEVRKRHGRPPAIAIYENVPGLLSTKDNAFGCLIGALAGCDEAPETETGKWPKAGYVCGETRRVGYRILDAQFFGVAQRRRRIFLVAVPCELVASLGDDACPSEILSLRESVRGNPPTRSKAGQGAAASIEERPRGGGEPCYLDRAMFNQGVNAQYKPQITQDGVAGSMVARGPAAVGISGQCAGTLDSHYFKGCGSAAFGEREVVATIVPDIANPLTHRMHKGMNTTVDEGQTPIVTTGGVFDEATCFKPSHFTRGKDGKPSDVTTRAACEEGGTGRGNPILPAQAKGFSPLQGGRSMPVTYESPTLEAGSGNKAPAVVYGVDFQNCVNAGFAIPINADADRRNSSALTPSPDAEGRVRLRDPGIGIGELGDPMFTMQATKPHAVAFKPGQSEAAGGIFVTEEFAPTMQAQNNGSTAVPAVAFTQNQREEVRILDIAGACSAEPGSHQQTYIAQPAVAFVKATNPHGAEEAPRYEEADVSACLNGWDERHDPPKRMVAFAVDTYNQTIGDTSIPVRVGNAKDSLPAVLIHAVAFAQNQLGEVRCNSEVMGTVNTNQNASGRNTPMVMHEGMSEPAVAFANRTRDGIKVPEIMKNGVVPALTNPGGGGRADAVNVCLPTPIQEVSKRTGKSTDDPRAGIGIGSEGDPMYTLQAGAQHGCHAAMQVRRLTPSECEFLQGFPAGHTAITFRKKPAADGPRYRALGNSMAVPCMVWLGHRIQYATKGDNT